MSIRWHLINIEDKLLDTGLVWCSGPKRKLGEKKNAKFNNLVADFI